VLSVTLNAAGIVPSANNRFPPSNDRLATSDKRLSNARDKIKIEWKRFGLYMIGNIVRRRMPIELRDAEVQRILRVVSVRISERSFPRCFLLPQHRLTAFSPFAIRFCRAVPSR